VVSWFAAALVNVTFEALLSDVPLAGNRKPVSETVICMVRTPPVVVVRLTLAVWVRMAGSVEKVRPEKAVKLTTWKSVKVLAGEL